MTPGNTAKASFTPCSPQNSCSSWRPVGKDPKLLRQAKRTNVVVGEAHGDLGVLHFARPAKFRSPRGR